MAKKATMPIHFIPLRQQAHYGRPGEVLCHNTGPQYFEEKLLWGSTNIITEVNCAECKRLYTVHERMCRGCGTMITEDSLKNHGGLCGRCDKLKRGITIVDVDKEGKVVNVTGAGRGKERDYQRQLDADLEAKKLATAGEAQYKSFSAQYNRADKPTTEEQNMAKKTTADEKTAKAAKAPKSAEKASKKGIEKAQEAAAGKRAEKLALKIKILVKENPKRANSNGWKNFNLYKDDMTVGEFVEAGGTLADVRWDAAHDYIELS